MKVYDLTHPLLRVYVHNVGVSILERPFPKDVARITTAEAAGNPVDDCATSDSDLRQGDCAVCSHLALRRDVEAKEREVTIERV